jgi:hypothetical protein
MLLGLALLPAVARAQNSGIAGVVKDATGAVLPGVTVEAASPALIEKVRTAITDDQGQYKIVDLRPGVYTVTFLLTGFASVKREGIELTSGFTVTANADLKVGSVAETLTVTSAAPVIDVQNVLQQRVLTREILDSIPISKTLLGITNVVPGLSAGLTNQDVGGSAGDGPTGVTIHGGRVSDGHIYYDDMRSNNVQGRGGGQAFSIFFNPAAIQDIAIQIGNLTAESDSGGVRINVIPKDGGNVFTGFLFANGTNGSLQSDNFTADLKARGVTGVSKIKRIFDLNGAAGGPIVKDKVWFFTAHRRWGNASYQPGRYFNANPEAWTYTADVSRQAYSDNILHSNDGRLVWQANRKNKFSFTVEHEAQCICYPAGANASPEGTTRVDSDPNNYFQVKWSSPVSNKLLLEVGWSRNTENWQIHPQPGVSSATISVQELSNGFVYRAAQEITGLNPGECICSTAYFHTFAVSYITGSHAVKVGGNLLRGHSNWNHQTNGDLTYQFLNGVPRAIVQRATPLNVRSDLVADVGLYAQDQWTVKRMTVNVGLRYTSLNSRAPAQSVPAGSFVPARTYNGLTDVPDWKDLTPRLGISHDLFGNGKTALKANLGKYLISMANGVADANNPQNTIITSASRTWNDNGNYIPDCDLLNPAANGECEALSARNFGQPGIAIVQDPNTLHGWGKRTFNWEMSAGIQHEVIPGVSANATYFRRWYGNQVINKNLLVSPSDYDPYCVTVPTDPRLPGGGGNQLCGFYDINPTKFGLVQNYVTFTDKFGDFIDHYDGVDMTVNARLRHRVVVQGGLSIGRELIDACDVVGKVNAPAGNLPFNPDSAGPGYVGGVLSSPSGLPSPSMTFCRTAPPVQAQVKFQGSYALPWWGLQTSATVQSLPGPQITASYVVPNALIAPVLGRNLTSATATLQLIGPGTLFADRVNQMDVRVAKTVKVGRSRIQGMFDVYNVFNASAVLSLNTAYAPPPATSWLRPLSILPGRLAKFGVQFDF